MLDADRGSRVDRDSIIMFSEPESQKKDKDTESVPYARDDADRRYVFDHVKFPN